MRPGLWTSVAILAAAGCGKYDGAPQRVRDPIAVMVYAPNNTKIVEMTVGESVVVRTYVRYAEGDTAPSPYRMGWVSKDTSVAVPTDHLGTIKGVKAGSTIITLDTIDRFMDTLQVVVH